jgi:threonine aldolase
MGGLAALGGIQTRTLVSTAGILAPDTIAAQLRSGAENYSRVTTRALAIENTHVRSGGRSWSLAEIDAVVEVTGPAGVALHCDGARIWNASVATGIPLEEYGRRFATLSVCMSKGLGAPVGSLVVTSAELARSARLLRRQLGGAMRQSGIIAAGALYALHHHLERLAEDHRHAAALAAALGSARSGAEGITYGGSNIVLVEVTDADRFVADAAARGVRVGMISRSVVRAVTHLDVSDEDTARAGDVLAELVARG